jgi:hypothetical protein
VVSDARKPKINLAMQYPMEYFDQNGVVVDRRPKVTVSNRGTNGLGIGYGWPQWSN